MLSVITICFNWIGRLRRRFEFQLLCIYVQWQLKVFDKSFNQLNHRILRANTYYLLFTASEIIYQNENYNLTHI